MSDIGSDPRRVSGSDVRSVRSRALRAAVVVALLGLAACADDPEGSEGAVPPGETEVDSRVDEARALFDDIEAEDPLCTAAVLAGTEVVFAEAFGSIDGEPATPTTPVDIASVSKQLTGVAIELLIDDGDLSGSDLVGDLVPEASPAADDLTVDELLTHVSGLVDYPELLDQDIEDPASQAQTVAAIAESEPSADRGTFSYSNSNYVLLAEVVESVSGAPLPELLAAEVFEPLGLEMDLAPRGPWQQVGDGSIWTTPTELVRWSSQYWEQTLDGPDLAAVMFDPEVAVSDDGEADDTYGSDVTYGSGVMRGVDDEGTEWLHHDGAWDPYETDWALIPDERLAAAVTCDMAAESDVSARDLIELWRP